MPRWSESEWSRPSRSGSVKSGASSEDVAFTKGDTLLIPAAYKGVISFTEETKYLIATV